MVIFAVSRSLVGRMQYIRYRSTTGRSRGEMASSEIPDGRGGRRLRFVRVLVHATGDQVSAEVHLGDDELERRGQATATSRAYAIGQATLDAVSELAREQLQLTSVERSDEVVLVRVATVHQGRAVELVGAVPVQDDGDQVVVRATLDAVNRMVVAGPATGPVTAGQPGAATVTAHQIRSPLAVVQQILDTLLTHGQRFSPEMVRDLLERASRQTRLLLERVDVLLDSVSGRRPDTTIEVRAELQAALADVAGAGDVELHCPPGLHATARRGHLREIAGILITNALQHGGPPVTVTAAATDHARIRVVVEDRGSGVPEGRRTQLFRTGSGSTRASGHGIGLAAARRLAAINRGELTYEPGHPKGARFILLLPAARGDR